MAVANDPPTIFVVDSSSWLEIETHTAQNRILSALVQLIEARRLKVPPEVWRELEEASVLAAWLQPHRSKLVENLRRDTDYLMLAGKIASEFPGMAGIRGRRSKADPWVVAMAVHKSNPHARVVVCNETVRKRPNRKMPTVCGAYGIECVTLLEMLHKEYPNDGWLD